ncbi:O-antigen ligase family protein [Rathayibacter agropyri]|uniref:O-antigen ligase family protein n=1 Tax=Rathayibacter agropyri TaxID=1634927 RepID=UPI001563B7FC|nr:O-antigen ligase family protein [Rathayibacter agropyri]NRD08069.1 O-antigen ligase family protein [Rathayibacter agropyri]
MTLIIGGLLVAALLLWLLASRVSVPAVIGAVLAVPQIYQIVPVVYSGALAWNLLTLPVTLVRMKASLWRGAPALLAAFVVLHLVYLPLSPSVGRGALEVMEVLGALAAVLAFVLAAAADRGIFKTVMYAGLPFFVLQSFLTIAFLVDPGLEMSYLTSPIAPYFSSAGVLGLFTTNYNNVVETFKAGGIYLNGNSASMTMGAAAFAYFGFGKLFHSRIMTIGSIIMFIGAIFTGSKTGIGLAVVLAPSMYLLYKAASQANILLNRALAVLIGIPALILGVRFVLSQAEQFTEQSSDSVEIRSKIWDVAIDVIQQHPIIGSGYGAFNIELTRVSTTIGVPGSYPPHNFLLSIWIDVGLAGVALILALYALIVMQLIKVVRRSSKEVSVAAMCFIGSVSWIFIHGMGDNTSFFGTLSTMPIFAAIVVVSRIFVLDLKEGAGSSLWSVQREAGNGLLGVAKTPRLGVYGSAPSVASRPGSDAYVARRRSGRRRT